jgi:hypothetical protein
MTPYFIAVINWKLEYTATQRTYPQINKLSILVCFLCMNFGDLEVHRSVLRRKILFFVMVQIVCNLMKGWGCGFEGCN